uniref:Spondin-like TSP1 domain-containing protein n=1 Tax=Globisporangium ultimum (strain ATCC 200006 / CBS 805.95 / DAOM BR144) TaxID=431595 RepID=K3XBZ8_GLOUD
MLVVMTNEANADANLRQGEQLRPPAQPAYHSLPEADVSCVVSSWTYSGCVNGKQTRTRTIEVQPEGRGKACPILTQVVPCEPVHCQSDAELDWSSATCDSKTGKKKLEREVKVEPLNGGQACGDREATQDCGVDCVLQSDAELDWSSTTCDSKTGKKKLEREVKVEPLNGGQACGDREATQDCGVDCVLQSDAELDWSSATCDSKTGKKKLEREVKVEPLNGGQACGDREATQDCGVDCVLQSDAELDWSSATCDSKTGKKKLEREVKVEPLNGGQACGDREATQDCAVDCVGEYGDWCDCEKKNGKYFQTRELKTVVTTAKNGGMVCAATEEQACVIDSMSPSSADQINSVRVNCRVSAWSYSVCEAGRQVRTRSIVKEPQGRGRACPALQETVACAPIHCIVSNWGQFVPCDASGFKTRTRDVLQGPMYGGSPCPRTQERVRCRKGDCQVSDWDPWTCDLESGLQARYRHVVQEPCEYGRACPDLQESKPCDPIDCVLSVAVEPVEECNVGTGNQTFSRSVVQAPRFGGASCPSTDEVHECDVDCVVSQFSDWGKCDPLMGQQNRTRFVMIAKWHHGKECPPNLVKTQECVVDCKLSDFGDWSDCDPVTGSRNRSRSIASPALNGGAECSSDLVETESCAVDCQVSAYGDWGSCDRHKGLKRRTRTITVPALNGGDECPNLVETQGCAMDCHVSEFGKWGRCDHKTGVRMRSRSVIVHPRSYGDACPALHETKPCDVDCKVHYSKWSKCDGSASTQTRTARVIVEPRNNGTACLPLHEERACKPVDCVCKWGPWSACDAVTGYEYRKRQVTRKPKYGGKACPAANRRKQRRPCTAEPPYML